MPKCSWHAAWVVAAIVASVGASAMPPTQTAPPLDGWRIADHASGGAVVLLSEGGELYVPMSELNASHVTTERPFQPGPVIDLPSELTAKLVGTSARIGDPWTIDSSTAGRFHAVVDHFVLGYKNCGEAWGVFLRVIPSDQGRFLSIGAGEYVAHPGAILAPSVPTVGEIVRSLSEAQRGALATLLEQARRQTIGGVRHVWAQGEAQRLANPAMREWDARWTDLDKALDRQDARLWFDTRSYRLTRDDDPRVYVEARWTVRGFVAYALTMWARASGSHFTIESIDAAPALLIRMPEMASITIDRTTTHVLGVFDVNGDGRAELLVVRPGYESIDRDLIEYPDKAGAEPRVISHYGDGC